MLIPHSEARPRDPPCILQLHGQGLSYYLSRAITSTLQEELCDLPVIRTA